ncbi:Uncharacterised protein [Nocardia africana]|uniref:Uncharacterized protein n=1 Tax=Nocardia africana TaxID=134964 RepID=A0A378X3F0_9NOCA|nr:Uncharacterised protein [Nocardia africana]
MDTGSSGLGSIFTALANLLSTGSAVSVKPGA